MYNKQFAMFSLGDYLQETQTGFEGYVTCISKWGNGQITYTLQPMCSDKSILPDTEIFDEAFLTKMDKKP